MAVRSDPYSDDVASSEALDLPLHCRLATEGSAWAALLVAINTKPLDLDELLRVIGVSAKQREGCFDAIADAWAMYCDALRNGADL